MPEGLLGPMPAISLVQVKEKGKVNLEKGDKMLTQAAVARIHPHLSPPNSPCLPAPYS